jgi:hypothetical protein
VPEDLYDESAEPGADRSRSPGPEPVVLRRRFGRVYSADGFAGPTRRYVLGVVLLVTLASLPTLAAITAGSEILNEDREALTAPFLPEPIEGPVVVPPPVVLPPGVSPGAPSAGGAPSGTSGSVRGRAGRVRTRPAPREREDWRPRPADDRLGGGADHRPGGGDGRPAGRPESTQPERPSPRPTKPAPGPTPRPTKPAPQKPGPNPPGGGTPPTAEPGGPRPGGCPMRRPRGGPCFGGGWRPLGRSHHTKPARWSDGGSRRCPSRSWRVTHK